MTTPTQPHDPIKKIKSKNQIKVNIPDGYCVDSVSIINSKIVTIQLKKIPKIKIPKGWLSDTYTK